MSDEKKTPRAKAEAGNLALAFEKAKTKGGPRDVVLSFHDGERARKVKLGQLGPALVKTELGDVPCWQFTPAVGAIKHSREWVGVTIKKKTAGEVKRAVNEMLFLALVGPATETPTQEKAATG